MRSRRVTDRLAALAELRDAQRVAAYQAMDDEVDLNGLWPTLRKRGTTVLLPRVDRNDDLSMQFIEWEPSSSLVTSRRGVGEPVGAAEPLEEIDVVLLPSVALDDGGTRVGFGAGFYDRALAGRSVSPPLLVGVAFDVQRMPRIEARQWDVPVDVVVTDEVELRPGRDGARV